VQFGRVPFEMRAPIVLARMKERREGTGDGIHPRNIRPFVAVAVQARECQILEGGFAAVLARNDVIYVERVGMSGRREVAVFTAMARLVSDLPEEIGIHEARSFSPRTVRALDCMIASRLPTCR